MTCPACLFGGSKYAHTCCSVPSVDELLIEMNSNKDNAAACGRIKCTAILCSQCPFFSNEGYTLGDLRDKYAPYIDPKPYQTHTNSTIESPKCTEDEEVPSTPRETQHVDDVNHPKHYMLFDNIEAIEVIARSMTVEMFRGYILGTVLKYRLRAGKKSEMAYGEKDLAKADAFMKLFDEHKDKCYAG